MGDDKWNLSDTDNDADMLSASNVTAKVNQSLHISPKALNSPAKESRGDQGVRSRKKKLGLDPAFQNA
jgi:hypothetical protein